MATKQPNQSDLLLQYLQTARNARCSWGEVEEMVRQQFSDADIAALLAQHGNATSLEALYGEMGSAAAEPRKMAGYAVNDEHGAVCVTRSDGEIVYFQGDDAVTIRKEMALCQAKDPDFEILFAPYFSEDSIRKVSEVPGVDERQTFRYDNETDSGFIIRNEGDGVFKAEEWRDGDIADNAYGTYDEMKAWTETNWDGHHQWRLDQGRKVVDSETKVVFRKWGQKEGGGIIALFPDEPYDSAGSLVMSYEHMGQHGGADYTGVIARTKPATEDEYRSLKAELEAAPYRYKLKVVDRRTAAVCVVGQTEPSEYTSPSPGM